MSNFKPSAGLSPASDSPPLLCSGSAPYNQEGSLLFRKGHGLSNGSEAAERPQPCSCLSGSQLPVETEGCLFCCCCPVLMTNFKYPLLQCELEKRNTYLDLFIYFWCLCVNKEIIGNFLSGTSLLLSSPKAVPPCPGKSETSINTLIVGTDCERREKGIFEMLVLEATVQSQCIQEIAIPAACRAEPSMLHHLTQGVPAPGIALTETE